ncbi:MAG: hypothetical protein KDD22_02860 [Bdellovibrionales bacterium]|nr:hypothetical protein [Bdellovibrionales bacterium]
MKKMMTILVMLAGFRASAADGINLTKLQAAAPNVYVSEATSQGALLSMKQPVTIERSKLACLNKQVELLNIALGKPENRAQLSKYGTLTSSIQISVYIPRDDESDLRLKSGLSVYNRALNLSFKIGYECELLSVSDLDREFLNIGVRATQGSDDAILSNLNKNTKSIADKLGTIK